MLSAVASPHGAPHGPRAGAKLDCAVRPIANEPPAQPRSKLLAFTLWETGRIIAGRPLLFEEGKPVVVERGEAHANRERLFRHVLQSMIAPERAELSLACQR